MLILILVLYSVSLTFWSFIIFGQNLYLKMILLLQWYLSIHFNDYFRFSFSTYFWQMPSLISILLVFIAAASGTILHLCLGLAYKYADLSVTQPSFTGLIFGSGFGYFVFNEIPDFGLDRRNSCF